MSLVTVFQFPYSSTSNYDLAFEFTFTEHNEFILYITAISNSSAN